MLIRVDKTVLIELNGIKEQKTFLCILENSFPGQEDEETRKMLSHLKTSINHCIEEK